MGVGYPPKIPDISDIPYTRGLNDLSLRQGISPVSGSPEGTAGTRTLVQSINRYVKRGTLDADLAEVMKKLAKDKMLRALSNVAYAKGDYEKEMGQAALKKEAKLRTK